MKALILIAVLFSVSIPCYAKRAELSEIFQSALNAYIQKDYNDAISMFGNLVNLNAVNEYSDDALFYLALCHYRLLDYPKTEQILRLFLTHFQSSGYYPHANRLLVYTLYRLDAPVEILNIVEKMPQSMLTTDILSLWALSFYRLGYYHRTMDILSSYGVRYPDLLHENSFEIWLGSALALEKWEDVSLVIEKWKATFPDSHRITRSILRLLTVTYENRGYDKVLHIIEKVLVYMEGAQEQILYLRGLCQYRLSDYLSAIQPFSALTNVSSYRADSLYYLGKIHSILEEDGFAISNLTKFLKDFPTHKRYLQALRLLAFCYERTRQSGNALSIYREMLPLESRNKDQLLYRIGIAEIETGDYTSAEITLRMILQDLTNSSYFSDALYYTGVCVYRQGRVGESIPLFLEHLSNAQQSRYADESAYYLALSYLTQGDYRVALSYIQMTTISQTNDYARYQTAWLLLQNNRNSQAFIAFQNLAREGIEDEWKARALLSAGVISFNQKEYDQARRSFQTVAQTYPSYTAEALLKIAWIDYKLEKFEELGQFLKTLEPQKLPRESFIEYSKLDALTRFRLKDYRGAIKQFESLLTLESENPLEWLFFIAACYYNNEEYSKAIEYYNEHNRKALELGLDSRIPSGFSGIIRCQIKMNELVKAEALAVRLYLEYPQNPYTIESLYKMGETYFNRDNYPKAIFFYDKLTVWNASNDYIPLSYYWLGWAYYYTLDFDKAIRHFENYQSLYPDGSYASDCLYRIAEIYQNKQDHPRAITAFQKVIRLYPESLEARKANSAVIEIRLLTESDEQRERILQQMIKDAKTPSDRIAVQYRLATHYKQNDREKANQIFLEIMDNSAEREAALSSFELGEYYRGKENYMEAIKYYAKIFYVYQYEEIYPQSLFALALSYKEAQDNQNARRFFQRLIKDYPNSTFARDAQAVLKSME